VPPYILHYITNKNVQTKRKTKKMTWILEDESLFLTDASEAFKNFLLWQLKQHKNIKNKCLGWYKYFPPSFGEKPAINNGFLKSKSRE